MKQLIICEKPSLANSVSKAISKKGEKVQFQKALGYAESGSYIVVPSFGHLFTLCDVEVYRKDYDPKEKYYWTLEGLPLIPNDFKFALKKDGKTKKVDSGIEKQFNIIQKLTHSNEISSIIHCGDSDREGEIIVRIILQEAKNTKPVYRLWLPDQVEETIIKSLDNLIDDSKYDSLANEGMARMYVDWCYGINLTRYASIKSGALLRVGRVISTIVKTIYDRDNEIKNFVPQKYYVASSKENTNGCYIELTFKNQYTKDNISELQGLCNKYNNSQAKVVNIVKKEKVVQSPKLFSQSTLQNKLSKDCDFAPNKTLSLVQSLYEKGYVSYPRTGTEYMASAEKDKVINILSYIGDNRLTFKDNKRIFDDSKIESHSAITPTVKIPKDSDFKSEDEKVCYKTIFNRFCSVFYKQERVIEETTFCIKIGDDIFEKKGTVVVTYGFKEVDDIEIEEKEATLPKLNIGDTINIKFAPVEKVTSPKKSYTVETLNNFLKNPFRNDEIEEMDDTDYKAMLEGLEIGTEATRSGIIATAIKSEYIILNKSTYKILPKGVQLVEAIEKLQIDMSKEKTSQLGKYLKDVYKGDKSIDEVVAITKNEIQVIFDSDVQIEKIQQNRRSIGNCPKCKKEVVENKKAFSCTNKECNFVIWKEIASKKLTESQATKLLTGKSNLIKGFVSKVGKEFSAYLVLKSDYTVGFEFEKRKK